MTSRRPILLALPLVCAIAHAQQVAVTVHALTPVTAVVGNGTQTWPATAPLGPLSNSGQVGGFQAATGAPCNASVWWGASAGIEGAAFTMAMSVSNGGAGSFGLTGPGEILLTFTGVGPGPIPWRLEGGLGLPFPNMSGLLYELDYGNDGTIDWTPNSVGPFAVGTYGADLAAQPFIVRVKYDGAQYAAAGSARLELRVVPGDIDAIRMPTNCYNSNTYEVDPLMSPVADLRVKSSGSSSWQVMGFTTNPVQLPIALTAAPLPCFLMPTPDWSLMTPQMFVQIPAAIRPISFYTQSIDVSGGYLRTSDTFLVVAH